MANIQVRFAGIEFPSPIWVASQAPPSGSSLSKLLERYERYVEQGAGAVETHWISNQRGKKDRSFRFSTRYTGISSKPPFHKEGFYTISPVDKNIGYLNDGIRLTEALKREFDVPVIANVAGPGTDVEGWAELARTLRQAGADLLELNFSCPMSGGEGREAGAYVTAGAAGLGFLPPNTPVMIGQVPSLSGQIVRAVKEATGAPVMAKMTPEVGYPHLLSVAKALVDGGADGITCINAPISVCPPDIHRGGRPRYAGVQNYAFGGTYGPWDRFLAYKFIAAIRRYFDIDISGVGGAVDPEHAVEFLMLGARTVQISSGIIWRGHRLIGRTVRFLEQFMDRYGYESVEQLIGLSQQYLVDLQDVRFEPSRSFLDEARCNGCGICVESICAAIDWRTGEERLAQVDPELCVGCGMCTVICPQGAFEIRAIG